MSKLKVASLLGIGEFSSSYGLSATTFCTLELNTTLTGSTLSCLRKLGEDCLLCLAVVYLERFGVGLGPREFSLLSNTLSIALTIFEALLLFLLVFNEFLDFTVELPPGCAERSTGNSTVLWVTALSATLDKASTNSMKVMSMCRVLLISSILVIMERL